MTDGDLKTLDYSTLSVVAIGAIQEQQALIGRQRQRIELQEDDYDLLKDRVEALERRLIGMASTE